MTANGIKMQVPERHFRQASYIMLLVLGLAGRKDMAV